MHILEHAIEVERLALIALQLTNAAQCPEGELEKAFRTLCQRRCGWWN